MIFCDSDAIALGALRAFHEEGISVPGDAELLSIGMLDPEAASYYVPSLSVVEMPNKEIGQQVLRLMRKKVLITIFVSVMLMLSAAAAFGATLAKPTITVTAKGV